MCISTHVQNVRVYTYLQILMNVLEIMDVIICAIILMVHSIAIVIQATGYIQMELFAEVDYLKRL